MIMDAENLVPIQLQTVQPIITKKTLAKQLAGEI